MYIWNMGNEEKIVSQIKPIHDLLNKLRDGNPALYSNEELFEAIARLKLLKNIEGEYIMSKYNNKQP